MRAEGLIREAGVSNFNKKHIDDILALGKVSYGILNGTNLSESKRKQKKPIQVAPIAANQVHFTPFSPDSKRDVVAYCLSKSIAVMPYGSLGGILS